MTPEPGGSSGGGARKASWKLDASLDEVIEAEVGHAAGAKGRGRGQGGKRRTEQAVNYWNEETGWTYKPSPPVRGGRGQQAWEDWEDDDDWGWAGKGAGKGSAKTGGAWWDSSYSNGRQEAGASASGNWTTKGDRWSSSTTWEKGEEWQPKQAGGSDWKNGSGRGGSSAETSWKRSPGAWQDSWSAGGSSGSHADGKGGGTWGGGAGYGASKPEPEPIPAVRGSVRTVIDSSENRGVTMPRGSAGQQPTGPAAGSGVRKHRLDEGSSGEVAAAQGQSKRVKVTNIPADLPQQDICDAFAAATGRISHFQMDRGTAVITFVDPRHAAKAMDTFDRGELNGNIISVKILP